MNDIPDTEDYDLFALEMAQRDREYELSLRREALVAAQRAYVPGSVLPEHLVMAAEVFLKFLRSKQKGS